MKSENNSKFVKMKEYYLYMIPKVMTEKLIILSESQMIRKVIVNQMILQVMMMI